MRDAESLRAAGWRVEIVWECETKDAEALKAILAERIARPSAPPDVASEAAAGRPNPDSRG